MSANSKSLELAEFIRRVREELTTAQKEGDGADIRFQVGEIELDVEVAVEEGIEGGIAAKLYVLTSHYKANKKDAVTQKLKVKLKPVSASKQTPGAYEDVTIRGTLSMQVLPD